MASSPRMELTDRKLGWAVSSVLWEALKVTMGGRATSAALATRHSTYNLQDGSLKAFGLIAEPHLLALAEPNSIFIRGFHQEGGCTSFPEKQLRDQDSV